MQYIDCLTPVNNIVPIQSETENIIFMRFQP